MIVPSILDLAPCSLHTMETNSPSSYGKETTQTSPISSNHLKKYAYRPFGSGDTAIIDPRTYFIIREYLHMIEKQQYPAAFVTTWLHTITEDYATRYSYAMPFHVNNIDLTVTANVLYCVTSSILTQLANPQDWFDEDVQMIYENTTNLITWMIGKNFSGRPDIALTYYPSVYNFYWFTARTLNILQTYASNNPLPYPVLSRVMSMLSTLLRGNVTSELLKRAIPAKHGLVYFEDFLGNDDRNILGNNFLIFSSHLITYFFRRES